MKFLVISFVLVVLCRSVVSDACKCMLLKDCTEIVVWLKMRPAQKIVAEFLNTSSCGFEGDRQKICCGPPPLQSRKNTTPKPTTEVDIDPVNSTDSYLPAHQQCGYDGGNRIYGGNVTDIDEFPWMALLGYKSPTRNSINYQCGGSLINARYVLTAGHCVKGDVITQIGALTTVRLGEYDVQKDPDCVKEICADPVQEIRVQSILLYPEYLFLKSIPRNDIALLRLAKRVTFTRFIQPICLLNDSEQVSTGDAVYVAGWGKTLSGSKSTIKLKVELPIFNKGDCSEMYSTLSADITDKHICAGGDMFKDSCKGDSGGPLMRQTSSGLWEAFGIISFGKGCGLDGWPGIYVSVASYMDWIKTTIRDSNV